MEGQVREAGLFTNVYTKVLEKVGLMSEAEGDQKRKYSDAQSLIKEVDKQTARFEQAFDKMPKNITFNNKAVSKAGEFTSITGNGSGVLNWFIGMSDKIKESLRGAESGGNSEMQSILKEFDKESGVDDVIKSAIDVRSALKKLDKFVGKDKKLRPVVEKSLFESIKQSPISRLIGSISKVKGHYASKQETRRIARIAMILAETYIIEKEETQE